MVLGVPVDERKTQRPVVKRGREIDPAHARRGLRRVRHPETETAVVNGGGVLGGEHPDLRRPRPVAVGVLRVNAPLAAGIRQRPALHRGVEPVALRRVHAVVPSAHRLTGRHTANTRHHPGRRILRPGLLHRAPVGRALVDADALRIRAEHRHPRIEQRLRVPVVAVVAVEIHAAAHPVHVAPAVGVDEVAPVVVVGVQGEGQLELLHVVQAEGDLRLALGLGQRRQQQPRQNGDDGDHHQQLDKRKATPSVSSI